MRECVSNYGRKATQLLFGLLLLLLLLSSGTVFAQVTTADLVGTVRDNSGAVVRNVKVTLTNVATTMLPAAETARLSSRR